MDFDFTLPGLGRPESSRPKRVGEAIRNELSVLLLRKVRDKRLQEIAVCHVRVTADLKQADIYYTLPAGSDRKAVKQGLARAKGFFRSHIAKQLNLRYTPELIFHYDDRNEQADHLDEIFRQIAKERKADDEEGA